MISVFVVFFFKINYLFSFLFFILLFHVICLYVCIIFSLFNSIWNHMFFVQLRSKSSITNFISFSNSKYKESKQINRILKHHSIIINEETSRQTLKIEKK